MLLALLQYCLSSTPTSPCYVLKCQGLTVMLDCALDLSPLLNFTPLQTVHRYVCNVRVPVHYCMSASQQVAMDQARGDILLADSHSHCRVWIYPTQTGFPGCLVYQVWLAASQTPFPLPMWCCLFCQPCLELPQSCPPVYSA